MCCHDAASATAGLNLPCAGRYLQEKAPVLIVQAGSTGKSYLAQSLNAHCLELDGSSYHSPELLP
jgi:hypothetical protein